MRITNLMGLERLGVGTEEGILAAIVVSPCKMGSLSVISSTCVGWQAGCRASVQPNPARIAFDWPTHASVIRNAIACGGVSSREACAGRMAADVRDAGAHGNPA